MNATNIEYQITLIIKLRRKMVCTAFTRQRKVEDIDIDIDTFHHLNASVIKKKKNIIEHGNIL